jgi:hypothetical protein
MDRVANKAYLRVNNPNPAWVDFQSIGALAGPWYAALAQAVSANVSIATGHDPSVDGKAAMTGALCITGDYLKAWLKYGTGNYDWRSLNETRASLVSAGGPFSALDISIAVAEGQRVQFEGDFVSTLATDANLVLRVNGAAVTLKGSVTIGSVGEWAGQVAIVAQSVQSRVVVKMGKSVNGWRAVEGIGTNSATWFYNLRFSGTIQVGAITSVGVSHAGGARIGDGTQLRAVVSDFHGVMP